jgi:RNA polymerase sigma-70 factor (ECF subfamily)
VSDAEYPSDDFLRWVATVAWRVARSVLDDDSLAEDVAQETVLRAIAHFGVIEASTVNAWVCTVARNCAIDMIRRRRRERLTDEPHAADSPAGSRTEIDVLLSELAFDDIVVNVLPERLQMIARLRYQQDLDSRTIGERTGRTPRTIDNNLVEIRNLVRASLGVNLPQ